MLLEDDLDLLAELELVGIAVDDVGGQPDPRILDDRDLRHHVGRRQPGQANRWLTVKPASVALPDTARTPMSR